MPALDENVFSDSDVVIGGVRISSRLSSVLVAEHEVLSLITEPSSKLVAELEAFGVSLSTETVTTLMAEVEALDVSLSAGTDSTSVAEVEFIGYITEDDPSPSPLGKPKLKYFIYLGCINQMVLE